MNAETFSVAMGEISDKYISEAMEQEYRGKRIHWRKWSSVIGAAACILLLISFAATQLRPSDNVQVYLGDTLVTEQATGIPEVNRGIALLTVNTPLSVQMQIKAKETTTLSIEEGIAELREDGSGAVLASGTELVLQGDSCVWWMLDTVDPSVTYTMSLQCNAEVDILTLRYDDMVGAWTINKSGK